MAGTGGGQEKRRKSRPRRPPLDRVWQAGLLAQEGFPPGPQQDSGAPSGLETRRSHEKPPTPHSLGKRQRRLSFPDAQGQWSSGSFPRPRGQKQLPAGSPEPQARSITFKRGWWAEDPFHPPPPPPQQNQTTPRVAWPLAKTARRKPLRGQMLKVPADGVAGALASPEEGASGQEREGSSVLDSKFYKKIFFFL